MYWAGISLQFLPLKMGKIVSSEMLVFNLNQMPGNYPKKDNLNTLNHGKSLKFNTIRINFPLTLPCSL
jgi:hypothetical protein